MPFWSKYGHWNEFLEAFFIEIAKRSGGLELAMLKIVGKVGFFDTTPITQPTAFTQTYLTADKTHAARTAQALTDNSGGTASQILAAITGGGAGCEDATKNAIASLADDLNKVRADQLDTAQAVNSLIDLLESLGLAA